MINALKRVLFSRIQILGPDVVIKRIVVLANKIQRSVDKLFNHSELVQYLDQLNSLTKLAQRLRVASMGLDGVSVRNAGMDLRYV